MANSRNKGAQFERDVAKRLYQLLGVNFARDLDQYRQADHGDLTADDPDFPFVIECKRYAAGTGCMPGWWDQAWRAAQRTDLLPCVIYKYDRRDIRCVIPLGAVFACHHDYTIEVDLETFAYICREIMADDD